MASLVEREDGMRGKEFDCFHFTSRASIGGNVPYIDAERQVTGGSWIPGGVHHLRGRPDAGKIDSDVSAYRMVCLNASFFTALRAFTRYSPWR
jgi:hypothetical protein